MKAISYTMQPKLRPTPTNMGILGIPIKIINSNGIQDAIKFNALAQGGIINSCILIQPYCKLNSISFFWLLRIIK